MSARTSVPSRRHRLLVATCQVVVATIAALLVVVTGATGAAAQDQVNSLQSITPEDGASLSERPEAIQLVFNQELADDDVVTVDLGCSFQPQTLGEQEIDPDRLIVTVPIESVLPKGACTIAWSLTNGDGEVVLSPTTVFTITSDPPATTTTSTSSGSAPTTTDPFIRQTTNQGTSQVTEPVDQGSTGGALWLGRLLSTLGILVIFGGLALISVGWPEGPEYVVTVRFLRAAWVISMLGTVLYVIAFTADFNGISLGAAISPGEWLDLNDEGWAGRGALLRLVLIGATGWVAFRPERIIDPQSAMLAWALPGFALVAVSLSRVDGPAPWLGVLISIAHLLGVAVWFGGASMVARVVLAGPGEEDLVQATRTFSRISMPAIVVTCATGIAQMIRLDGGDLFSSSHGRVLLLKSVAVAAMLFVSLAARQQVTMRLDRAHELTVPTADRFRRAFGAEAAFGVVALAFSSWLLGLTPTRIDPFPGEEYTREIEFLHEPTQLDAVVKIGPAQVGLNGFRIEVESPPDNINNLTLTFVPPATSGLPSLQQPIPLSTSGTAQLATADGLPFQVGGEWILQLSVSTATGTLQDATASFEVFDAEGNPVLTPQTVASTPTEVSVISPTTPEASFATTTTTTTVPTSTSAP